MPITLSLRYTSEGETIYLNPYATPAIIACILSTLIGIYVFYKNPKNIQNRVFILFISFVVAFSIGEAMLRLSSNSEEGLLWGRIAYLGVIFMPLALLHLSFVFLRKKSMFSRYKYVIFGLYSVGIILLLIFNLTVSVQDVKLSQWGYRVALSSNFYFISIYFLIASIFVTFNFFTSYIQSKTIIERKQVRQVFYGALIGTLLAVGTNVISPIINIEVFPLGTIGLLILTIFIGAALIQYNLFLFKPIVELGLEEKKPSPKKYELEPSKNYIVQEESGKRGYEIFTDQITHDISGLCITKYPPQSIREKYGFEKTPLFWFTFKKSDKETTVNPQKIDVELIPQIEDFVKKGKRTMVYIDCFDQVSLVKGFENTLTLISDIKNICRENHSILLLSINPNTFEEKQISTLEKEFLEVK